MDRDAILLEKLEWAMFLIPVAFAVIVTVLS
jgi:hypothetical protein